MLGADTTISARSITCFTVAFLLALENVDALRNIYSPRRVSRVVRFGAKWVTAKQNRWTVKRVAHLHYVPKECRVAPDFLRARCAASLVDGRRDARATLRLPSLKGRDGSWGGAAGQRAVEARVGKFGGVRPRQ